MRVRTPEILLPLVWPPPRSLATTSGISVDVFSSPYLEVSVQAVPHVQLFDSLHVARRRVSPFGNLRIEAHLQLPEAYRSLSRPSSAPDAKAFPLRSFMLDLVEASSVSLVPPLSLRSAAKVRSLRCLSSQIQTRLRWALNLFESQTLRQSNIIGSHV